MVMEGLQRNLRTLFPFPRKRKPPITKKSPGKRLPRRDQSIQDVQRFVAVAAFQALFDRVDHQIHRF
jgi:hypothetical protein